MQLLELGGALQAPPSPTLRGPGQGCKRILTHYTGLKTHLVAASLSFPPTFPLTQNASFHRPRYTPTWLSHTFGHFSS